jgi:RNA polymerase sigma factor (sigma-70 family)
MVEMKRFNGSRRDDRDEENGEPVTVGAPDPRPRADRSSGVRVRGARPPDDHRPCDSFDEVHTRYERYVWLRISHRLRDDPSGVDDVCQQVFIWLDQRILERGSVPHPVKPVLLGLMEDAICNHARAEKRRRSDAAPDSQMPSSKPDPEQLLGRAEHGVELQACVKGIFARMDQKQVELIKLSHLEELHVRDIAGRVGRAVATVRVELCRARARFRELYTIHRRSRSKP